MPQTSPWRSTKSGLMPLLEASHAPSQASAEEEGPRREDVLLVRSRSHEQREVTHQVSHVHCLFCRELEFCPEMESAGISSHLQGSSSSLGARFSSPAPRRPSDPVEGALSECHGLQGGFHSSNFGLLMYWHFHCSLYMTEPLPAL